MTARATGGAGGAGTISGAGGNAIATATGTTTSLSDTIDATSNVTATATGGSGSTTGTANASATANTANGQQATASSTASGRSDTGSTTATTLSSGLVTNVTATTSTSGGGTLTGESGANIGGSLSGEFTSQFSASAFAVGSPNSSVNSIISTNSNINAQLGSGNAHAVVFGAGTMSAFGESNATGTQTLTSSETFTLNATNLAGNLILGLASPITANVTGTFSITTKVGGTTIAAGTMTFATLAAANTFFTNDAINLGSFSHTNGLTVQVTETMVTSTPGAGFANELVLGATSERGPVITAPASAVIGVGKSGPLGAISLAEAGSAPNAPFSITLSDTHGDFSATASGAATVGGGGTTSLTIHGTLADINNTLATLKDTDASTSADTVTINATDVASSAAATPATIAVTVNGAPSISAPASAPVAQNVATAISGVSVSETGNTTTSGETFTVVVSDSSGVLSANTSATGGGGTITPSNGGKTLTFAGTLSQVDADLTTLKDNESSTSADTLTVAVTDSFGNSATKSLPVTVTPASGNCDSGADRGDNRRGQGGRDRGREPHGIADDGGRNVHGHAVGQRGRAVGDHGRQRRRRDDHAFERRQDADNRRHSFAGERGSNDACRNGCDDGVRCHFRQRLGQQWWIGWARYDRGDGERGAVDQRAHERAGGAERSDGDLGRQRFGDRQHDDQRRNLHSRGVGQLGRSVGHYQRDGGGGTITPSNGNKTLTIAGTLSQVDADLTTLKDDESSTSADTLTVSATDSFGNSATKSLPVTVTPASGQSGGSGAGGGDDRGGSAQARSPA